MSNAFLWIVGLVLGSTGPFDDPVTSTITEKAITQTLSYLASDELAGRESPSPGLEKAANYIQQRFAKAGLKPFGDPAGYFHEYELDGSAYDSRELKITVHLAEGKSLELAPNQDVRMLEAARDVELDKQSVHFVSHVHPERNSTGSPGRQLTVLEVEDTSPLWTITEGRREFLGRSRGRRSPLLLVRAGVLPEGAFEISGKLAPMSDAKVKLKNVMGYLPGSEPSAEMVIVSAHYDHIGARLVQRRGEQSDDYVFNGADDNATGTTGVLLLAETFAKREQPLKRGILFVCFSAEEKGLRGSRAFAESGPLPKEKIAVVVNLEMLGRPEPDQKNKMWVTGSGLSDFTDTLKAALKDTGASYTTFSMSDRLFGASDNWPFAAEGVVAHSISAGSLHEDYHGSGDHWQKTDRAHMETVIRGLHSVVARFADQANVPQYNEAGRAMLKERGRR